MVKRTNNLRKVSIARLKQEMQDTVFLSDDLAITTIDYLRNPTSEIPVSLDGFAAMIMMSGTAVLSIDTDTYEIRPNMLVFFRPGSVIRTIRCSSDATAYLTACSKSFVNDIQVDISASLPIHMRFGRKPCLQVTEQDVTEIRAFFRLIKMVIQSDMERFRKEIIHTLFTAIFYLITELNQRDQLSGQVIIKIIYMHSNTSVFFRRHKPQMMISKVSGHPAFWSPAQESYLKQIRLMSVFNGDPLLSDRGCYSVNAHRSSSKPFYYGRQNLPVQPFESHSVYFKGFKPLPCRIYVYDSAAFYL